MRQFRNNTGSPIFVSDVGVAIPLGTYDIPPENYGYWAQSVEIDTLIDDLDVTLVFDGVDIDPYEAKRIVHQITDYVNILANNAIVRRQTKEINVEGNITATDDDDGKATFHVGGAGQIQGGLFSITFTNNGSSSDRYMDLATDGHESGDVPAILPFNSKLMAMTFSNKDNGVDVDLFIVKNDFNDNDDDLEVPVSWEIRNERVACLNLSGENIVFPSGTKVALFMYDQGTNPDDPVVTLWFQVQDETILNDEDNYSGDFEDDEDDLENLVENSYSV